jgi:hypothetical protein
MKSSPGFLRAAWTFVGGSFFGALALFALLGPFRNVVGAKAEPSRRNSAAAHQGTRTGGSPRSSAVTRPSSVSIERRPAGSARPPVEANQTTLDLQLD